MGENVKGIFPPQSDDVVGKNFRKTCRSGKENAKDGYGSTRRTPKILLSHYCQWALCFPGGKLVSGIDNG